MGALLVETIVEKGAHEQHSRARPGANLVRQGARATARPAPQQLAQIRNFPFQSREEAGFSSKDRFGRSQLFRPLTVALERVASRGARPHAAEPGTSLRRGMDDLRREVQLEQLEQADHHAAVVQARSFFVAPAQKRNPQETFDDVAQIAVANVGDGGGARASFRGGDVRLLRTLGTVVPRRPSENLSRVADDLVEPHPQRRVEELLILDRVADTISEEVRIQLQLSVPRE
mmetsp:Transcript_40691/g.122554  ORF Transcript_40691/g.122554 Transcript_40691/m.122554 type:complete len:231 (-) Transcript_40691:2132-2824(-)